MGDAAENLDTLEEIINSYTPDEEFNKIVKANGMLNINDTHGNMDIFKEACMYADDYGLILTTGGDLAHDYEFLLKYYEMGYQGVQDLAMQYFQSKLSEKELEVVSVMQHITMFGGLEKALAKVPQEHLQEAQNYFNEIINYAKSEFFEKKMQKLEMSFMQEKQAEILETRIREMAYFHVFFEEEAKRHVQILAQHENVTLAIEPGNHEHAYFAYMMQRELKKIKESEGKEYNPNQIIDLNTQKGYLIIQDENGHETTVAGISNTGHFVGYLSYLFPGQTIAVLYNHMVNDPSSYAIGEVNEECLKKYNYMDRHWHRIKDGNEQRKLEVLISHGKVGETTSDDDKYFQVKEYLASAGMLSLEAEYTLQGHNHKTKFDGKNIRAIGNNGVVLRKDENGKLYHERVDFKSEYRGIDEPHGFDNEYMKNRIEEMVKVYKVKYNFEELIKNGAADDYSSDSGRKAG